MRVLCHKTLDCSLSELYPSKGVEVSQSLVVVGLNCTGLSMCIEGAKLEAKDLKLLVDLCTSTYGYKF